MWLKTYEINGKKYKVERVSADSKTQLIDRLVYLLIDLRNERLNSSNQGEDNDTKQASDYVVAIYCKLSKDDGLDGDSSSIQNQKETLIKYCNDNNYLVGGIYCDDGYSGTNFAGVR